MMPDTPRDQEQLEMFDQGFQDALMEEDPEEKEQVYYSDFINRLATDLYGQFSKEKGLRYNTERRWLKDLRQYRGVYDPETLVRMDKNRSKAFVRLTRTKVKTLDSRLIDLLFPVNGEKNWSIKTTPVPELDDNTLALIAQQIFMQTGQIPTPEQIRMMIHEEAIARAESMEKEMEDQLAEIHYRSIIRSVIHSGNLYGTGVLKGPFIREKVSKRWGKFGDDWAVVEIKKIYPTCEFVPVWDIFPDMSAKTPDDLRFVFQRHIMGRHKLSDLAKRSDFNGDAIRAYIKGKPEGNAQYEHYECDLRDMSTPARMGEGENQPDKTGGYTNKYEVIEFWGYIGKEDLIEAGIQGLEDMDECELAVNAWFIENVLIKAVVSPIEGMEIPYYFYYFDKDETSIFGDGIPYIMRDPQMLFNAGVRAMLDNAAISAGPIIEANVELLARGEDPNDIYPFRVFQRKGVGVDATAQAFRVTSLPSYTNEFMGMVNFFMTAADEVTTIPRYMHGDQGLTGAASQTATGLSMLMGSANITLKDQVKIYDDFVTKRYLRNVYHWNMEFNEKEEIKGDFEIVPQGSTSLIAKEVQLENLNTFLGIATNEVFQDVVNYDEILRELMNLYDLDNPKLIRTKDEIKMIREQRAQAMAQQEDKATQLELVKAQSSGHVPGAGVQAVQQLSPQQLQQGELPDVEQRGI
jgi:hypothetical protein